jgi:HK97 family phage major capsid protein
MRDAGPIRSGHYPNGSDKLITLVHKLKTPYRNGAVWVMNKTTAGAVRQLKTSNGELHRTSTTKSARAEGAAS